MNAGKIVFGLILLVVAAYLMIFMESVGARFFGGGILAVLGLASVITGFIKKKPPTPPPLSPTPEA